MKTLAAHEPETFRQLSESVHDFAAAKVQDAGGQGLDLDDVLNAAAALVDDRRQRARANEMEQRILEEQAAQERRRTRLTSEDPDVQDAVEKLKRLTTISLQLLRDHGPSKIDGVAIRLILAERAERAAAQLSHDNGQE